VRRNKGGRRCITCVGEVFGLFKEAIRPFGNAEIICTEKRGSAEKERVCEWEIRCIWDFGL
jgi:hypothetical protein